MFSREILLPEPIPVEDLKQFVEELGGEWQDCRAMPDVPDDLTQGHFADGDAGVFLRGALDQTKHLDLCDPDEMDEVKRRFGKFGAAVVIDITRTGCERGFILADHVTAEFLKRWPGLVSDDWAE